MPPRRSPRAASRCSRSRARRSRNIGTMPRKIFDWGQDQTCNLILDDGGDATMFALWGARVEAGEALFEPTNEEEEIFAMTLKRFLKERPGYLTKTVAAIKGVSRRDHHRRPPPLRARQAGQAPVPGDQRQRQRDQVEVRQSLRLQGKPGRRDPPRAPTSCSPARSPASPASAMSARARRPVAAQRRRARAGDRSRPDLRAAGGDGRL